MAINTTSEMAKMRLSAVLTSRDRESNSLIIIPGKCLNFVERVRSALALAILSVKRICES